MAHLIQLAYHHHALFVLYAQAIGNVNSAIILTCSDAISHAPVSCGTPPVKPVAEGASWINYLRLH